MIYFFFMPVAFRAVLASALLLGGALGTVSFIERAWIHSRTPVHAAEMIYETVCFAYGFVVGLMGGTWLQSFTRMSIPDDFFPVSRTAFPILIAAGAAVCSVMKRIPVGIVMFLSCFSMSVAAERFCGGLFPYAVLLSVVLLLARNAYTAVCGAVELRRNLSVMSIKAAIDTLPTGIMLCETDGRPRLVNNGMKRFVESIGGTLDRGGNSFWKYVYFGELPENTERHMLGACPVIVMPDKTAYMLSRDIFSVREKAYFQTAVTDVTRRWRVNEDLESRCEQLTERSRELAELLKSVDTVCRDREIVAARGRVHDILGQRITIFQRYLNSGKMPSKQKAEELVNDLSERLRHESIASPERRFDDLCETLSSVGVNTFIHGSMPENRNTAECFFKIIREATTNSVRHGFATELNIYFGFDGRSDTLTVCDNGTPPEGEVRYGTGIKGMQRIAVENGGVLEIVERPNFTVKSSFPRGE